MAKKENKNIFDKVRKMWRDWKKGNSFYQSKKHSGVEAELGRHETGRSVAIFTRDFWNEANVSRRVEGFLRKRTRTKESGRLQQAKEKTHQRNARLSRLRDSDGFSDLVNSWKQIERTAYVALRHPELRKEGVSLDYYVGFQNGILSDIEANRRLIQDAEFAIAKEEAVEQEKESESKKKK